MTIVIPMCLYKADLYMGARHELVLSAFCLCTQCQSRVMGLYHPAFDRSIISCLWITVYNIKASAMSTDWNTLRGGKNNHLWDIGFFLLLLLFLFHFTMSFLQFLWSQECKVLMCCTNVFHFLWILPVPFSALHKMGVVRREEISGWEQKKAKAPAIAQ